MSRQPLFSPLFLHRNCVFMEFTLFGSLLIAFRRKCSWEPEKKKHQLWRQYLQGSLVPSGRLYLIGAGSRRPFFHDFSVAEGGDATAVTRLLRTARRTDLRKHQLLQTCKYIHDAKRGRI